MVPKLVFRRCYFFDIDARAFPGSDSESVESETSASSLDSDAKELTVDDLGFLLTSPLLSVEPFTFGAFPWSQVFLKRSK